MRDKPDWVITNLNSYPNREGLISVFEGEGFSVFANTHMNFKRLENNSLLFIEGYILPRLNSEYTKIDEIINDKNIDHNKLKTNFKGFFNLIIISKQGFKIFTDQLGHSKFLIFEKDKKYIITNNLLNITCHAKLDYSSKGIVSHIIFNRFIDGTHLYNNVRFTDIGEVALLQNGELKTENYFNPTELLNSEVLFSDLEKIKNYYQKLINGYLDFFKPQNVSVPLTGGFDCRTIVSAMLNTSTRFQCYTYSHPNSIDSINGAFTAKSLNIPFKNHFLGSNIKEYKELRETILKNGNGLVSSHRAHRLYGLVQEAKESDLMFLGYLGGESIRGLWPDDLIISKALRLMFEGNSNINEFLIDIFNEGGLEPSSDFLKLGEEMLTPFKVISLTESYFNILIKVKSHLHYAQDLQLFNPILPTVNLYTDIDYLEMIFASPFNLFNQSNMTHNKLQKINAPLFQTKLIRALSKPMAAIKTGKGFSPDEFLSNKWKVVIKKGIEDFIFKKKSRVERNFKYGEWYHQVINSKDQLDPLLLSYFNKDLINRSINNYSESNLQHLTRVYDFSDTNSYYNS